MLQNNAAVFAAYTSNGSPQPISSAANNIGAYFDGGFWTGASPPISYSFWPYSAVIDMETGEVLAMDTQSSFLTTASIMAAVQQANSD